MTTISLAQYTDAIETASPSFVNEELLDYQPIYTKAVPHAFSSGRFAHVFKFCKPSEPAPIAVRCFAKFVPDIIQRYEATSKFLKDLNSRFFVPVRFLEKGIRIYAEGSDTWTPVIMMGWVSGTELRKYIEVNLHDRQLLEKIRNELVKYGELSERKNFAHCDLQPDNMLINAEGNLQLVDYDSFYLPEIRALGPADEGSADYRSPKRQTGDYGPWLDRFSLIVLDLTIAILQHYPELYEQNRAEKFEGILFGRDDFYSPETSEVICKLQRDTLLSRAVGLFRETCHASLDEVPPLQHFRENAFPKRSGRSAPRLFNQRSKHTIESWTEIDDLAVDALRTLVSDGALIINSGAFEAALARLSTSEITESRAEELLLRLESRGILGQAYTGRRAIINDQFLNAEHHTTNGITERDRRTLHALWLAAEAGDLGAQFELGLRYYEGNGVERNYERARHWFQLAAQLGYAPAQHNLAGTYANGEGVPRADMEALRWLRLAANQGWGEAQYALGLWYELGRGVTQDNIEAVAWYRAAAEKGHRNAQSNLGVMYYNGTGTAQSNEAACQWWRRAAEQGHAEAQRNLAAMYANGWGIVKDEIQAALWMERAAEQGVPAAQYWVGVFYEEGRGVRKNDQDAYNWYVKAAAEGDADAKARLAARQWKTL